MKPTQVSDATPGMLDAILHLEQTCIPAAWQYPDARDLFSQALHDTSNISIALFHDQEVVGYALACPMASMIEGLKQHDPEIETIADAMYLETIAVHPTFQRQGGGKELLQAVSDAAGLRGYRRLAIHARCCNQFNNLLKRQYAGHVEVSRHLHRWFYGGNEPYEFMVIARSSREFSLDMSDQIIRRSNRKHL